MSAPPALASTTSLIGAIALTPPHGSLHLTWQILLRLHNGSRVQAPQASPSRSAATPHASTPSSPSLTSLPHARLTSVTYASPWTHMVLSASSAAILFRQVALRAAVRLTTTLVARATPSLHALMPYVAMCLVLITMRLTFHAHTYHLCSAHGSPQLALALRFRACLGLVELAERKRDGLAYRWVVRSRPDVNVLCPLPVELLALLTARHMALYQDDFIAVMPRAAAAISMRQVPLARRLNASACFVDIMRAQPEAITREEDGDFAYW